MREQSQKLLKVMALVVPIIIFLTIALAIIDGGFFRRLALLVSVVMVISLSITYCHLYGKHFKWNQLIFMVLTLVIESLIALSMGDSWHLFMPLLIGAMLIAMLVDEQMAIILHVAAVLVVSLIAEQGSLFIVYYILMGMTGAMSVRYARVRNNMLIVVIVLSAISGLIYWLLNFAILNIFDWMSLLFAIGSTGLAVVIVLGSLPLWESIFQVMTPLKLMVYTDTNHPLLQKLLKEAPGTYHHAQMVANLAERGARAIEANAMLTKAGALFHDVGKLKEPNYFIENQNGGPNPHDEIAAEDSASIIIDHVSYGVKLGIEHKLPKPIIQIIRQHHGTTLVKYFYHKAQNYNDGVAYNEEKFRYRGPKPQSKESAIVMLADCVEAFVRSLNEKDRHLDKIKWVISEITRQKFEDGQLDLSELKVKELKLIELAFIEVYTGLYHERITYPTEENTYDRN